MIKQVKKNKIFKWLFLNSLLLYSISSLFIILLWIPYMNSLLPESGSNKGYIISNFTVFYLGISFLFLSFVILTLPIYLNTIEKIRNNNLYILFSFFGILVITTVVILYSNHMTSIGKDTCFILVSYYIIIAYLYWRFNRFLKRLDKN